MNGFVTVLDRITLRPVLLVLCGVALLLAGVLVLSIRDVPDNLIHFEQPDGLRLAEDGDITAQITLDRDSYFLGQHATSRVRVLYRPAAVTPDFDKLKRSLGFLPFDQLGMKEVVTDTGNGVSEYLLDYELHIIGARKPGSYPFEPAMLFYSRTGGTGSNLQSIRIPRPELRIGSIYPWNAGTIPLRGIREPVFDQAPLRRDIMLAGVVLSLLIGVWILWRYGRRRGMYELALPEKLWQQYRALDGQTLGNRKYLLGCEKIFTGLLYERSGIDPESFWSGAVPADIAWRPVVEQARHILGRLYQAGDTTDADVRDMDALLAAILGAAVQEQRLQIEQQPSFLGRLLQQRGVVRLIVGTLGLALVMLVLAFRTDWWVAPEISGYNATVAKIREAQYYDEALLLELQSFAASAKNEKIRSAALYNSGTVRARYGFSGLPAKAQQQMLDLVFQAESADALLETIMLVEFAGSQEDVVTLLVNAAENLSQAELDLQSATRTPDVENEQDALRNLELVTRWRHAILTRLVELRDMFSMKPGTENEEDIISDQGLVNVIEAKLPEEYEDAEMAKDNSHYIIFERF